VNFTTYQLLAHPRILLPEEIRLSVFALGLTEEAGEVAGKVKKLYRDKNGIVDDEFIKAVAKELSDVLFYVRGVGECLGLTLEEIAQIGIDKLDDREKRGVLQGEGDDR
jgi:NTP pyrophosphatase (non-canonical NTP hydrolase)